MTRSEFKRYSLLGCELWLKHGHSCEDCPFVNSCVEYKPERKESKEVTLEVRCSKCGRILGYYKGETFWIDGLWKPSEVRIVCLKCRGGRSD